MTCLFNKPSITQHQIAHQLIIYTSSCVFFKICSFLHCVINSKNHFSGNSSLHFAVKGAHFKIALFLLESGAEINLQNKILQTPLFLAVRLSTRMLSNTITLVHLELHCTKIMVFISSLSRPKKLMNLIKYFTFGNLAGGGNHCFAIS